MATAFVTGANGFIGGHLVAALEARGVRVRQQVWKAGKRLALPSVGLRPDIVLASLDDVAALTGAMADVDIVYHLAGRTAGYSRAQFEATNTRGVANLLEAAALARPRPRRLVLVSSAMAAGPSGREFPLGEAHMIQAGRTLYGDSKLAAERLAWRSVQDQALEIVIVRPPLVYGPGDHDVLQLIRSARSGIIAQPGLDPCPFSAIYVDDLVDGLIRAAERGRPLPGSREEHVLAGGGEPRGGPVRDPLDPRGCGIYYLTDGGVHTATTLGRQAAEALGRRAIPVRFPVFMVFSLAFGFELAGRLIGRLPTLTVDKARGSVSAWWCDDRRARVELGFESRTDMHTGMRRTVEWYRAAGMV